MVRIILLSCAARSPGAKPAASSASMMCCQRLDKVISFPHGHRGARRWNWWNRWNCAGFSAAMWDRRVELVGPAVAVMLVEPSLAVPPVPPRSSTKIGKIACSTPGTTGSTGKTTGETSKDKWLITTRSPSVGWRPHRQVSFRRERRSEPSQPHGRVCSRVQRSIA